MPLQLLWALLALAAGVAILRAMRGKWDLLASHARDLTRHGLSLLLMTGTLAGTVSTFSGGRLTLPGVAELWTSVLGLALALELGAIFCGWFISQLDARILTERRKDKARELRQHRKLALAGFVVALVISVTANLIFRIQQLGSVPLAVFVSLAPAALIVLFTIILRSLPIDYREKRRQAVHRALFHLASDAERTLASAIRDLARGGTLDDSRLAAMRLAVGFLRMDAQAEEQHNLDYALTAAGGPQRGVIVESDVYWTSRDIRERYPVSDRTAQAWMANCPGRRKGARGNSWEVPSSAILSAHGEPQRRLAEPQRAQQSATEPQQAAGETHFTASEPQTLAAEA